jgi:hypothetical protein
LEQGGFVTSADVTRRLKNARSLDALLDAAYAAFEQMLAMIERREDSGEDFYAALAFAAAAAADGRDAILTAPSLPPAQPGIQPQAGRSAPGDRSASAVGTGNIASDVATLSDALAAGLAHAAETAAVPEDRAACRIGAQCAREIQDLLTGT